MTSPPSDDRGGGRSGKAALRVQLLARRDQLADGFRSRAAAAIRERAVAALADLAAGSVVGLYASKGSEVDIASVEVRARQLGLRVAYPRVVREQRWLAFHLAEHAALRPARFGLVEPPSSAPEVELTAIGAFLVPGIAFDEAGGRLGWGKGYYDSTFARAPQARRIGLAFECQVVPSVPQAEHDIPLHVLFTEAKVRHFGA